MSLSECGHMEKEIQDLLKKHGFPRELQVAQIIRKQGWIVDNSVTYTDPELGISRELDVYARRNLVINENNGLRIGASLVVSVKNNTDPFLCVCSEMSEKDKLDDSYAHLTGSRITVAYENGKEVLLQVYLKASTWHHYYDEIRPKAFKIGKINLDDQKKPVKITFEKTHPEIIFPLIKCLNWMESNYSPEKFYSPGEQIDASKDLYFAIWFPVLVVNKPLYVSDVNTVNKMEDKQWVGLRGTYCSEKFHASYHIDIVVFDFLESYLQKVEQITLKKFCGVLLSDSENLRSKFVPKREDNFDKIHDLVVKQSLFGDGMSLLRDINDLKQNREKT